ncbi:hypothetical protein C7S18_12340 [Ahniella affigens]|uniref:Uncharacterized protein n=1 Tax=Ahniella affigens TaxID=2021234 RepID=A0A2P1PSY8_9GAMM|nr:hypothetical protein [Ahniella affigens]AVP97941.1 hypothetical protein C7S18_12340 [Ahniella affigens]
MTRHDHLTRDMFSAPRPAPLTPGSQDYRAVLAHLLSEMFAASGKDRWQIAADASRLSGHDISKLMLDGYTSEARDNFNCPAWLLPVLEAVCCSHAYTEWLAGIRGGRVLLGEEVLEHDVARLEAERAAIDDQVKALRKRLQGSRRQT